MTDREWEIEMLWRCSVCERENKGRDKVCENCTAPKKESDPFYMPGSTEYESRVTDERQIRNAKAGADWSCRFCDSAQRKNDGTCARCGVDQTTGRAPSSPAIQAPAIDSIPPAYQASIPAPARTMDDPSPLRSFPWRRTAIIASVVLGVALLFYFLFRTKDVQATVSGLSSTLGS